MKLVMRLGLMNVAILSGLATGLYILATALEQLGFTHRPANLPLPEAASMALFSLGLFGFAAARRRV